jgi:hypothetical protein
VQIDAAIASFKVEKVRPATPSPDHSEYEEDYEDESEDESEAVAPPIHRAAPAEPAYQVRGEIPRPPVPPGTPPAATKADVVASQPVPAQPVQPRPVPAQAPPAHLPAGGAAYVGAEESDFVDTMDSTMNSTIDESLGSSKLDTTAEVAIAKPSGLVAELEREMARRGKLNDPVLGHSPDPKPKPKAEEVKTAAKTEKPAQHHSDDDLEVEIAY